MKLVAFVLLLLTVLGAVGYALYERGLLRLNHPSRARYPVWGLDVSHHQGPVEWPAVRDAGIEFAFIKASEGADHRDREFERNWRSARSAGLARGAYHFFTFCSPGLAQAENFISAVGESFGELPPVADVEFAGNCRRWQSIEQIREQLRVFLSRVEASAGSRPLLYFTRSAHERILSGHFDDYPAWPRSVFFEPAQPGPGRWLFWQFADNGRIPGVTTPVDLNVFRHGRAEFERLVSTRAKPGT